MKLAQNKKAHFEYFIEKTMQCGIVLTGAEVKACRAGKVSLVDTYARVASTSLTANISILTSCEHKLLVNKSELTRLKEYAKKPGYTLVPVEMFLSHGLIKVLLGICKGKHAYDKRETIKKRDAQRELRNL